MKTHYAVVCMVVCFILTGCAAIQSSNTDEVLTAPVGSGGLELGMTKSRVVSMYGEPDAKSMVTSDKWNEPREEWFYSGRFSSLPVNAGYLAQDFYLYFDGDNLTNISKKPLGRRGNKDAEENIK